MNETFPSANNLKMLVRRQVKVPKIRDFPQTIQRQVVSLFDAKNVIYVLSDDNLKG